MLTSPSGKSYIGQTIERNIENRLKKHRTCNSLCRALVNAVKEYSWESFEITWYECPNEELDKHEEMLIEVFDTLAPSGYNLKKGGSNNSPSQETKDKIRNTLKGQVIATETRQKMSATRKGRKHNWGSNISKAKQKISDEQILECLSQGKTQKMIAHEYGLTAAAISYRVKKLNAPCNT